MPKSKHSGPSRTSRKHASSQKAALWQNRAEHMKQVAYALAEENQRLKELLSEHGISTTAQPAGDAGVGHEEQGRENCPQLPSGHEPEVNVDGVVAPERSEGQVEQAVQDQREGRRNTPDAEAGQDAVDPHRDCYN